MIKANEIRLGNWIELIYCPYGPDISSEYKQVDIEEIQRAKGLLGVNSFRQEPIPLTPEILEKCGLVVSEDLGDMVFYEFPNLSYGYGVCYDHEEWEFYRYSSIDHRALIHDASFFQSLHQLQNIYFSLTGEEFEIEL